MHYKGPDSADLMNVFVLNNAFIAWQRTRPLDEPREHGLAPEIRRDCLLGFVKAWADSDAGEPEDGGNS